jgi:sec-independent protein translocase protein TatB
MLFDLGWSEILLIGVVALVFIGPKDLPKAMRVAGYWVRKARTLSREFQSSIDQMIREAELDEMRQELKKASEFDLNKEFHNTIDPTGGLREGLKPPELASFSQTEGLPSPVAEGTVETIAKTAAQAPMPSEPASGDSAPAAAPKPEAAQTGAGDPAAAAKAPTALGPDIVPPKP